MTAIRCAELELRAGYKTLLRNFSIDLDLGDSMAVTGPNGLGKTTLLRTLCGVSKPYKGRVELDGVAIWPAAEQKLNVGSSCYLASHPALFLDHSVSSNLEFYLRSHGVVWSRSEALDALRVVGLGERLEQTARTLSTGQKRRLTLAFLMLARPRFLFLDEPTNGLDTAGVELCLKLLTEFRAAKTSAILVATHDTKVIEWCEKSVDLTRWVP